MALKGGADEKELQPLVRHCVLCGACGAVCPMGVDTIGITISIKSGLDMDALDREGLSRLESKRGAYFMPGSAMRADEGVLRSTAALLRGYELTGDDAEPLVASLEGRQEISQTEAARYMGGLRQRVGKLVLAEGILHRLFMSFLGTGNVIGIGEALLGIKSVRCALRSSDMYIIDSRAFHADFKRMLGFYDGLRREHGLMMNLDLQRSASSPGVTSGACGVNPEAQARWIMNGRDAKRVVVERVEDMAIFKAVTDVPVVHLCQAGDEQ